MKTLLLNKHIKKKGGKGQRVLTVILNPFLIKDGNNFDTTYKTGIRKIDMLIVDRLKKDYTDIKSIFTFYYDVVGYKFENGKVYVDLAKQRGGKFTEKDKQKIKYDIVDPHNIGPDTWMEGDIRIIKSNEHPQGKTLELGVEVIGYQ